MWFMDSYDDYVYTNYAARTAVVDIIGIRIMIISLSLDDN